LFFQQQKLFFGAKYFYDCQWITHADDEHSRNMGGGAMERMKNLKTCMLLIFNSKLGRIASLHCQFIEYMRPLLMLKTLGGCCPVSFIDSAAPSLVFLNGQRVARENAIKLFFFVADAQD
jgi:hypothetical protein